MRLFAKMPQSQKTVSEITAQARKADEIGKNRIDTLTRKPLFCKQIN